MPKHPLEILPPKKIKTKIDYPNLHPNIWDINEGQAVIQLGKIKSGKTVRLLNYFYNPAFYLNKLDIIYLFTPTLNNDNLNRHYKNDPKFVCFDEYSDMTLQSIIDTQEALKQKDGEAPKISIVFDDILTMLKQNDLAYKLASNFRHYNIRLLIYNTQKLSGVPPVVRSNATGVCISKFNSMTQEQKIFEEYEPFIPDFKKYYEEYTAKPYSFVMIKLDKNPAEIYNQFVTKLYPSDSTKEQISEEVNKKRRDKKLNS